jgi:hypothetical protein
MSLEQVILSKFGLRRQLLLAQHRLAESFQLRA